MAYAEKSYEVAREWLETGRLSKAMFFSNGSLVKGFIKACLKEGLQLGKIFIARALTMLTYWKCCR